MVRLAESFPKTTSASAERRINVYDELGEEIDMSMMRGDRDYYSNETTVEGGSRERDVEALVPGGILKTVHLQQT